MDRQAIQTSMAEGNAEYNAFVEKFRPKLTTDDCYTPDNIFKTVRAWVFARYGLDAGVQVIRPFWPGGDYRRTEYPQGCVVIDNPPFSILAEIEKFYLDAGIPFFLFAPGLSLFKRDKRIHYVIADAKITYQNGAIVLTNFVTSMGEYLLETAPGLYEAIDRVNDENLHDGKKKMPKYEYPMEVVTAARMNWLTNKCVTFRLRPEETAFVRKLDAQEGKSIFGGGLLIGKRAAAERAAAEHAAAERAAAIVWKLSDREKEIIEKMG